MDLVIVESPNKCKKIAEILGGGYMVVASVGHVRDLPSDLPPGQTGVEPPDFKPRYVFTERGKQVIEKIRPLAAKANQVFLATDPDREGEAIAWHLKESLKLQRYQRVTFNEITQAGISAGMAAPRQIDMHLVFAQEARRTVDRHVGFLVTQALRAKSGQGLTAGRVQSVAVRLVVDRKRSIDCFKPVTHFGARICFGDWSAEWDTKAWLGDPPGYFFDRHFAGRISLLRNFKVIAFKQGTVHEPPPAPFITSTLQQAASVRLGLNPGDTMALAQKLFEQGAITYMRTDSFKLSDEALMDIFNVAQAKQLPMANQPRVWKSKSGAQEAHEAIRPTHFIYESAGETEPEKALYALIWKRAFASQLADASYFARAATLHTQIDGKPAVFKASGRKLKSLGWRNVLSGDDTSQKDDADDNESVPALYEGMDVISESGEVLEKTTRPPSKFTEASLVQELEARGIGRPSTFAAIMQNIVARGYIGMDQKRRLDASELACKLVDSMQGTFTFMDYDYTRELEEELDEVAEARSSFSKLVSRVYHLLSTEILKLQVVGAKVHACPDCQKALIRRPGKFGHFWSCSGFPACKATLPDLDGAPGVRRPTPTPTSSEFKCSKCKAPLIRRTKAGVGGFDFFGCSGFPKCKQRYEVKDEKPVFDISTC